MTAVKPSSNNQLKTTAIPTSLYRLLLTLAVIAAVVTSSNARPNDKTSAAQEALDAAKKANEPGGLAEGLSGNVDPPSVGVRVIESEDKRVKVSVSLSKVGEDTGVGAHLKVDF